MLFAKLSAIADQNQLDPEMDDPPSNNSKAVVYDLDAPGTINMVSPQQNTYVWIIVEYAVPEDARNSVAVSGNFPWFSRVACGMDENNPSIVFLLNSAEDNLVGQGSPSLSQWLKKGDDCYGNGEAIL
jgi:hypothetical protein